MSVVAIIGAGEIGGAVAHRLALRARVREIVLIDKQSNIAEGKALDIQQSGPIDDFDTRLSATADVLAATRAGAIVLADAVGQGDWQGDAALALVRQLAGTKPDATFVCAGPNQLWLMEAAVRELRVPSHRVVGSASSALASAARAVISVELNSAGADVQVAVVGRAPSFVPAWSSATAGGSLLTDRVAAHRLLAIAQSLKALWPPGAHAIGVATARVVEGLMFGSRSLVPATTVLDGELNVRGTAAMLPLALGHGRVLQRVVPSLSSQERTALLKSLDRP